MDADVEHAAAERREVHVRDEPPREERRPEPRRIERGGAEAAEAERGQVPVDECLREVGPADLVQLEAREALDLAVALRLLPVDVVVPEATEVEIRERLTPIPRREAAGGPKPDRRVR